ncbi:MAG: hypothetical protein QG633_544 [Patescibacteria group bacterium]|jgi:hypothetical protein|nr:hypothetical protein [Patescibacteria group bacterium]
MVPATGVENTVDNPQTLLYGMKEKSRLVFTPFKKILKVEKTPKIAIMRVYGERLLLRFGRSKGRLKRRY